MALKCPYVQKLLSLDGSVPRRLSGSDEQTPGNVEETCDSRDRPGGSDFELSKVSVPQGIALHRYVRSGALSSFWAIEDISWEF